MKKLFLLLLLCQCCFIQSYSQLLKKYPISNSGCSAYFFCNPGTFTLNYSEDSARVYTGECNRNDVMYGIICIKLKEAIPDMTAAEDILVAYLDFLKSSFKITASAGYGKGHRLRNNENIHGMIDYWQDGEKNNWKIKGWTDRKYIAVLYAYAKGELPEQDVNVFLDGMVFEGM